MEPPRTHPNISVYTPLARFFTPGVVLACVTSACVAEPPTPGTTAAAGPASPSTPAWTLVFADEFDAPADTPPDPARWTYDLGGGGWGNQELQTYTDRTANARHDGQGHLILEARREAFTGDDGIPRDYTSARLKTQGLFATTYGRVEARLQLPTGQGIWPAFWMLGESITTRGWPACGEIDVMEYLGHQPDTAHGTVHLVAHHGAGGLGQPVTLPDGARFDQGFHVFAVEWTPDGITWLLDDQVFHRITPDDTRGPWPFDEPHFLILNLAVGGQWPGAPDDTTVFPQRVRVDYVRVYHDPSLEVDAESLATRDATRFDAWRAEAALLDQGFTGAPVFNVPGDVRAADYREGGAGVAYQDTTVANLAGGYRNDEAVDVGRGGPPTSPWSVGYIEHGEWLTYTVHTPEAGRFRVAAVVACDGPGGTLRVRGTGDAVAEVAVPDTQGWAAWRTVDATGMIDLPAGESVLRVDCLVEGTPRPVGNLATLTLDRVDPR